MCIPTFNTTGVLLHQNEANEVVDATGTICNVNATGELLNVVNTTIPQPNMGVHMYSIVDNALRDHLAGGELVVIPPSLPGALPAGFGRTLVDKGRTEFAWGCD